MEYGLRNNVVVMDIECYPNYFLTAFRDTKNQERIKKYEVRGKDAAYSEEQIKDIKRMLRGATIVTFNGNNYDMPILMLALKGVCCDELKAASDLIIENRMKSWEFYKYHDCNVHSYIDHIDLFGIPAGTASLKAYSARIGCNKLQDLPIDPSKNLTDEEMDLISSYCDNDTANTVSLYHWKEINPNIMLRCEISKTYGIDMRSKSDAQVGEAVFKATIESKTRRRLSKPDFYSIKKRFKYTIPDFISFHTPQLKNLLQTLRDETFFIAASGHVILPESISNEKLVINGTSYTMGIGGLHSNENGQAVIRKDGEFITDADVGSYYPAIIINGGYYPSTLGQVFLDVYTKFRDDRIAMKPDKSKKVIVDTYKIVLNGTFGKMSSQYSFLYAPKMMIHVTLTGQLSLLMLIERIEASGMRVISANTDGIVIHGDDSKKDKLKEVISLWEIETGYVMEYTDYDAIYSQSVNSYLALKPSGEWKRKGDYSAQSISVSGNGQVCIDAVMAYLKDGTPIRETIESCKDFIKFTNFQQVSGGATKDGVYLGKVVRWYYGKNTKTAIINSKGNTVPMTQGAVPCMNLPDTIPNDLDFNWYVRESFNMLDRLGVKNVTREREAFGLSDKLVIKWGRREDRQTWHKINMQTKDALCEARLKDRHEDWEYLDHEPQGRICVKCAKK